ncbi:hypothetical protein N7519_000169 [Penicillium mononematosum]|uniref:uncharacterized protein n=1 Tax=Penicillium mononematosum TaxID=268346 RepID=UPI002548BF7E|nr:uncharacterized protein N7519_000169 [Penicillium mononematosum]KAJ6190148.1 hypothetical protein N7519_000169 [Penicillium mononematosum]
MTTLYLTVLVSLYLRTVLRPPVIDTLKKRSGSGPRRPPSALSHDPLLLPKLFTLLLVMPSRSQGYRTQESCPSSRHMEARLSPLDPSVNPRGDSHSSLELPLGHSEWGLATYSHDRGGDLETRSFSFRDDQVRSIGFNGDHRPDHDQDRQSNCTSFDGLNNVQSPDHIRHCYANTNIDRSAQVFNGDVARAYDSSSTREHHLHGGSVKNKSKLVNGDLDRDTFLAFFCNSNEEARQEEGQREELRPRRRGPRRGGRALPQGRV